MTKKTLPCVCGSIKEAVIHNPRFKDIGYSERRYRTFKHHKYEPALSLQDLRAMWDECYTEGEPEADWQGGNWAQTAVIFERKLRELEESK